ncbi:MAG: acyltransferase [Cyanobium sp. LacPavin_0920_WC12_MAG_62_9]|nr:acyltransferase [Cyanobium sp. LacPavin_0920_WC12_MAG_62_9]
MKAINLLTISRSILSTISKLDALTSHLGPHRLLLALAFSNCGKHFRPGRNLDIITPGRISIGSSFATGRSVRLHAWPTYRNQTISGARDILITIGNHVFINDHSYLTSAYGIRIGDHCLIGSNVLITDNAHGDAALSDQPRIEQPLISKGAVDIGCNVWICNNVVITSGVQIGSHSILAANSVVTCSVPEACLVGGVPARVIRYLR